ncbi:hypothetical protein [Paraburkholderia strydomiana]|uniref:hypothetical protein n=1 Tax=Paraburkholderia strydomiana TaxID=1245417 RepID=UPI001BE9694E|nr:hypothetical protein [Paraburkholderia strydomiana]MBT2793219.1 hypothetical protein [Paraburkholderia strydomiana]
MTDKQSANQTGIVPDERVSWVKNPLVTQIRFHAGIVGADYIEIRYYLAYINPSDKDVKWTAMPTPDGPEMQLYSEGRQILPAPRVESGIEANKAAPRDEEIKANASVVKARDKWATDGLAEFVIMNSQFLTGTHIYEVVYWHTQLDWIDVREVLDRTDSQGKGRMMYPITDNAPSNRLYFKVYKPTDDEARQGRHIEFLGEVDARTQVPALPYARPGDFAPKTGYWSATGKSIDRLGGYHEVFVREGDSMPNLPGDKGVDPFSFQWKYVGEHSQASVQ